MGAECSSEEPKQQQPQQPQPRKRPQRSCPSPIVSSFASHRRGDASSLTSSDDDMLIKQKSVYEPGCDGRYSFSGYVPLAKIQYWLDNLAPPEQLSPIEDVPIPPSDPEEDERVWKTADDDVQQATWDAPHYVSALDLPSPNETPAPRRKKK